MTTATLGEVADFINGFAFKPEDWHDHGLPIVRIQNLTDSDKPINLTMRIVPDKFRVRRGELLVSWSATLGVFAWDRTDEALVNQHIFRVVPGPKVDHRFLRHMLEGALVSMERHLHGATMKHVNRGEFLATEIPLPAPDEQCRIAAILDQADALRVKRRQALAYLDALTQSIFHDMFEGSSWPEMPLAEVVRGGTSVTYGIVQAGDEFDCGVPYIRTGDIVGGQIIADGLRRTDPAIAARFDRSTVRPGDIVMSIRATVGTTAVVPAELGGANLTQGTARIAPSDQAKGPYLLGYLRSEPAQRWIQAQVKGATFREITLRRLRELPVPLPPLDLQETYAARVAMVESCATAMSRALVADQNLFASLQSRAFRGDL